MQDSSAEWPTIFNALKLQLATMDQLVQLSETWEQRIGTGTCARSLVCGLVRPNEYEDVTSDMDLGYEVTATGPYPYPRGDDEYIPKFWIHGDAAISENIEPLVLNWSRNNKTVHQPDSGLLMTYGLVPRVLPTGGQIHWDEPSIPSHGIVVVEPVSHYTPSAETKGGVTIQREYLQDYASLRKRAVVCVFYERWIIANDTDALDRLGSEHDREWRYQDAVIRCQRIMGNDKELHIEISGRRLLISPGPLPISEDANRYGELNWPGVEGAITDANYRGHLHTFVFVKDSVLSRFEGRTDYSINPESGSVSFGNQWIIDRCNRVGRDLLVVEVRKLYEGTPPDIVRHYHAHAVARPTGTIVDLRQIRNIGVRAKDVVSGMAGLGTAAAQLVSSILKRQVTEKDLASFDVFDMRCRGWWNGQFVEPICRHAPPSLTLDTFLARCKSLHQLLIEGLDTGLLRQTLTALGVDKAWVNDAGSLSCLDRLIDLAHFTTRGGLNLVADAASVISQFPGVATPRHCSRLFALNALRQLDAHRARQSKDDALNKGLRAFRIEPASTVPGYGNALDSVYDGLAEELNACAVIIAPNRR